MFQAGPPITSPSGMNFQYSVEDMQMTIQSEANPVVTVNLMISAKNRYSKDNSKQFVPGDYMFTWRDDPNNVAQDLYMTLDEVNKKLLEEHKDRVLRGDPPLSRSQVRRHLLYIGALAYPPNRSGAQNAISASSINNNILAQRKDFQRVVVNVRGRHLIRNHFDGCKRPPMNARDIGFVLRKGWGIQTKLDPGANVFFRISDLSTPDFVENPGNVNFLDAYLLQPAVERADNGDPLDYYVGRIDYHEKMQNDPFNKWKREHYTKTDMMVHLLG